MIKLPEPTYWATTSGRIFGTKTGAMLSDAGHAPDTIQALYTEAQLKQAIKDALEEAAKVAWNHYMDTCKKNGLPAAEFGYWMACDDIRKLKEQLK